MYCYKKNWITAMVVNIVVVVTTELCAVSAHTVEYDVWMVVMVEW